MSLALFAAVAGGAALAGYLAGRAARRRAPDLVAAAATQNEEPPWGDGDVLCFPGDHDVVLAGERRMLRDGAEVARMYVSEAGDVVVLWPPPDARVLLLRAIELDVASPPPSRLEVDGVALERTTMLSLDGDDRARLAEYRSGDRAACVLCAVDGARVWAGRRHAAKDVDRRPREKR